MKLLQKDHEIEADSIKSEDIENEKIWMTGNEDLEGVIARFYGKWSEFNYSVARSEELQDYSHCSKQIGIGKVRRSFSNFSIVMLVQHLFRT